MVEHDEFIVREWADGSVVFDRLLGSTHAFQKAAVVSLFGGDIKGASASQIRAVVGGLQLPPSSSDVSAQRMEVSSHDPSYATVKPV